MLKLSEVSDKVSDWTLANNSNAERAATCVEFAEFYEQWTDAQKTERDGKEAITASFVTKYLRQVQALGQTLELSLGVQNTSKNGDTDIQQTAVFNQILSSIILHESNVQAFSQSLKKTYSEGRSALYTNVIREGNKNLNKQISIECINDFSKVFFDMSAKAPHLNDGDFCGFHYSLDAKDLNKYYKKLKLNDNEKHKVIDYWYRKPVKKKFYLMSTREYVVADRLSADQILLSDKSVSSWVDEIWFSRFFDSNETALENKRWYCDSLPLVYNYGLTKQYEKRFESFPFIDPLIDTQTLANYSFSNLAQSMKTSFGTKYIGTSDHVQTDDAVELMTEINKLEGFVEITGDTSTLRREDANPIDPNLLNVTGEAKGALKELVGQFTEEAASNLYAASGKALNAMFSRQDMLQNPVIKAHMHCVKTIGNIVQDLVPKVYSQERTITVSSNGKSNAIVINQDMDSGGIIKNDISSIDDTYEYSINIEVMRDQEKEITLKALTDLYQIDPQAFQMTADIWARSLPTTDADEIELRLRTIVNPNIIKLSNGEISETQFEENEQKNEEQTKQGAAKAAQLQQELMESKIATEKAKVTAQDYRAKAEEARADSATYKAKLSATIDLLKLDSDNYNQHQDRSLETIKTLAKGEE